MLPPSTLDDALAMGISLENPLDAEKTAVFDFADVLDLGHLVMEPEPEPEPVVAGAPPPPPPAPLPKPKQRFVQQVNARALSALCKRGVTERSVGASGCAAQRRA